MGYVVSLEAPRRVALAEYEERALGADEVRLRTLYSGISAGTELASYRGTNPYLNKRWDAERRLFVPGSVSLTYPLQNWGYEEVGEVVERGSEVSRVKDGDIIWGTWGHRSTHIASENWAAERLLAAPLEPICGIFSHIGAVALNATLDAGIHVGECVAVFGQGVLGLIVSQLVKCSGGSVIAVDGIARRLELAAACGADYVINFREQDAAQAIKTLTENRGADVSIEVSGHYSALNDAIRATAYNSRVVAAGFFQGEGTGLFLGEEFHHNRIQVVCSQISGVNPRLAPRWNRQRLSQTVMRLQAQGKIDLKRLVSHVFAARNAGEAFHLLDENPAETTQVVLKF